MTREIFLAACDEAKNPRTWLELALIVAAMVVTVAACAAWGTP